VQIFYLKRAAQGTNLTKINLTFKHFVSPGFGGELWGIRQVVGGRHETLGDFHVWQVELGLRVVQNSSGLSEAQLVPRVVPIAQRRTQLRDYHLH